MTGRNAALLEKTIRFYDGSVKDIEHTLKVLAYAALIAAEEGLTEAEQELCQAAAILHDISCPLCREKYGHAAGKLQEQESRGLIISFLEDQPWSREEAGLLEEWVCHHHSPGSLTEPAFSALIEADYLVNASESRYPVSAIGEFARQYFRTETGWNLIKSIYGV